MLAALILLTLGVDDELVCWDYEQTELGLTRTARLPLLKRWKPWVRRSPHLGLAHPCRRRRRARPAGPHDRRQADARRRTEHALGHVRLAGALRCLGAPWR